MPPKKNSAKRPNSYSTYGDMFYDLLDSGHDPKEIEYAELVSNWLKLNILKNFKPDCIEIKWLMDTVAYFCLHAKRIWKQHRGKVSGPNVQKKHSKFFDKYIEANLLPCTCPNCSQSKPIKAKDFSEISNSSKLDSKEVIAN